MERVKLTADLIESFSGTFLSPRYDQLAPTPPFHREAWALYASDYPQVEVIAPREHAKSTALTMDYILAETLFRVSDYVILIGSTEDMAAEQLSNIKEELLSNEDLIREFGVKDFESDTKNDIIVRMLDGHRFRVLCRGAEQRIRGRLWKGKRPNLMVMDDAEDDEQVENTDRRAKFRRWFFRAAKQALSKGGRIRVHGTILHEDSLLSRLMRCSNTQCSHRQVDGTKPCEKCGATKTWKHLFYKAHNAFDDFSGIIWPEQWSEERLRLRRQEFIEDGDAGGYSQEFLNDPQDNAEAFLRRDDFIAMAEKDFDKDKRINVGWDFAVSKADLANRTSCTVGGKDAENVLHFLDFRVGRWNPSVSPAEKARGNIGWIDLMFEVDARWKRHDQQLTHYVEGGVIWNATKNMVFQEMQMRDRFLNIEVLNPVKDKAVRGTALKKIHRAGATRWNTQAEGYEGAKEEMLKFTGRAAARLDDQFDSAATLVLGFGEAPLVDKEDFYEEEDWEQERGFWNRGRDARSDGRSRVTGY